MKAEEIIKTLYYYIIFISKGVLFFYSWVALSYITVYYFDIFIGNVIFYSGIIFILFSIVKIIEDKKIFKH